VNTDDILALAGRLLLASIFIFLASAFGKITNFDATVQYMETHGLPSAPLLCAAAVAVEALGGVALILGYHARWGAGALALFLLTATWIFHTGHTGPDQRIHLLKNLAILGGLLQVMAFGPGAMSFEGRGKPS
jgi:putative oxidoreductase